MGILEEFVELKCSPSLLLPEIAGAGGFLQGDQGDLMTPGFPEKNYPSGALFQVHTPAGRRNKSKCDSYMITFT